MIVHCRFMRHSHHPTVSPAAVVLNSFRFFGCASLGLSLKDSLKPTAQSLWRPLAALHANLVARLHFSLHNAFFVLSPVHVQEDIISL